MKTKITTLAFACIVLATPLFAQTAPKDSLDSKSKESPFRRCYIGSSFFMLGNLNLDDPNKPDFYQLNFGYWLTKNDVVSLEFKTWKYAWPVGIPYGNSYGAADQKYPGYVRDYGVALVYQRFIWKGLYAAVHAFNSKQIYVDSTNKQIQTGYQLFMTYRIGYHIKLFKNRFFLEPSIAMTHWPIRTNVPASFENYDKRWPNYFLVEPGLHFGVKF